jgi:hypothetical protein
LEYTATELLLIIAAVGAVVVNVIIAWRTGKVADQTLIKAAVIEGHVNSKETKYNEQIISLQKENELLKNTIADKDKTAALLAQSIIQRPGRSTDVGQDKV